MFQDFANSSEGIFSSISDFGSETGETLLAACAAYRPLQQSRFQQLDQTLLPVLDMLALPLGAGLEMLAKLSDFGSENIHTLVFRGDRAHHWRMPAIARHHQREHRVQLLLEAIGAFTIRFVEHENVADLH